MSERRDGWSVTGIGLTAAVAAVGIVVGFAVLPLADATSRFHGVWDAICSAAGLIQTAPGGEAIVPPDYKTTQVTVTPGMLAGANAEMIGRGATLALRCSMCHGARGMSLADAPNLAGQFAIAIYKQLVDFRTGARASAIMAPLVADLTDTDMRELAAYYAYLPRVSGSDVGAPPVIVASGAPMRGIAPCGACHGTMGDKAGAPWLGGQPVSYLHAQLAAFAADTRHNDIDAQMRNVARQMTPAEIDAASRYYAASP